MNVFQRNDHISRLKYCLSFGLVLAGLALLIYYPGLSGPYILDDNENITKNEALAIEEISLTSLRRAMQSNDSGPFKRPLATLTFAFNHYFSDGFENTFAFKFTNLIIHTTNGILVFILTLAIVRVTAAGRRFSSREQLYMAGLVAVLWTVHPIQLTNILYVVQRMNGMSALFVFLGLILFVHGRHHFEDSPTKGLWLMATGLFFGTFLGMASKENAALLPLLAVVIEYSFFQRAELNTYKRVQLHLIYSITLATPMVAFLAYLFVNPEILTAAYEVRHFSMSERLLTETRVLWNYIGLIVLPYTPNLGLFHDDIRISRGLFSPPETVVAICGLAVVLMIAVIKRKQVPVIFFATFWFLAGHLLESSMFGLEIAYEHRNYLPAYGILFAISYFYIWVSRFWNARLRLIVVTGVILTLCFTTWARAYTWKDLYSIAEANVVNHPESPRANELAARISAFEKGDLAAAVRYTIQGLNIAPDEVAFHLNLRLFMALLSSQIDAGMKSSGLRLSNDAGLTFTGLPPGIIATINHNHVQLDYPPSSTNTVESLLGTKPITVHTLASLEGLARCLVEKPDLCRSLAKQILRWHAIATDNPVTTKNYKALLLHNAAELHANTSDYQSALRYIDKATQIRPDILFYRLRKIEYLVKLGNLDEAKLLLESVNKIDPENDIRIFNNRAIIESVRNLYTETKERQIPVIRNHHR
jgi:tetratricopeptide (TPR) repeat protein